MSITLQAKHTFGDVLIKTNGKKKEKLKRPPA